MPARHVIEVGPGPGGLTRALLDTAAARVTAVELDARAVLAIRDLAGLHNGRLRLLEADAMSIDLAALCDAPRQIVANLPYNVATPLLIGWLRQASQWERLTLMFQLEVAERIAAAPDTEAYGRLAVLAQWTCTTSLLMRIPRPRLRRRQKSIPRWWVSFPNLRNQMRGCSHDGKNSPQRRSDSDARCCAAHCANSVAKPCWQRRTFPATAEQKH